MYILRSIIGDDRCIVLLLLYCMLMLLRLSALLVGRVYVCAWSSRVDNA